MSLQELLAELPALTLSERQVVARRLVELDDPGLNSREEALIEERLSRHRASPSSAVSLEDMNKRLRGRFGA